MSADNFAVIDYADDEFIVLTGTASNPNERLVRYASFETYQEAIDHINQEYFEYGIRDITLRALRAAGLYDK